MPLTNERLHDIVAELATRPRHEKVRTLLWELLVVGLGATSTEIDFEKPIPEVRGRIDALLGRTVFEIKRDLRTEARAAEEQLTRYLPEREQATGDRFVGIATDGATFIAYEVRQGALHRLDSFQTRADEPRGLLGWLSAAVAVSADLSPTPELIQRELGKHSIAWFRALADLEALWQNVMARPDVRLKRDLWARLLERVYGNSVDNDELFFQHTYLSIIAKTMATQTLGINLPSPPDLLSGRGFTELGILGAVESDFFDWVLDAEDGAHFVTRVAVQASRFRLRDVEADVLKGLYESLIDPQQRHDLGEYYTPDWLASEIVGDIVRHPLDQRVLDPACGSGTFIFHAVRHLITTGQDAELDHGEILSRCLNQIFGVDIHPLAVQIARVTYLLALGDEVLAARSSSISIPIYLGDSMQWNTRAFLADREVLIQVPDGPLLEFPFAVARDPALFDSVIDQMLDMGQENQSSDLLRAWLERRYNLDQATTVSLVQTYRDLRELQQSGRNHIWGFVARNLVRPVWLSQNDQRADVILGNPPWLAYNRMAVSTQERFKTECERLGVWVGGRGITPHQDLSAYFFARSVELYLRPGGEIGFIMPYAALTRTQYERFRTGFFGRRSRSGAIAAVVRFTKAWSLSDAVKPLFPVPASVIFATHQTDGPPDRGTKSRILPASVRAALGTLPRRDATAQEARKALRWHTEPWPDVRSDTVSESVYADRFRQGAIIIPRMLFLVDRAPVGRLGSDRDAPLFVSHRSSQEKEPWKQLPPLRGNVEKEFVRPLLLGESIAPFRILGHAEAVIPWDQTAGLLDSASAERAGFPNLARWMLQAEELFTVHGRGRRQLSEQLDFYRQLTAQLPPAALRVVYSKAGSLPTAAIVRDPTAVIDHKLYWAQVESDREAYYLTAILNSETARSKVEHLQSRGQWGARDFDKVMFSLPIPKFSSPDPIHGRLSDAAREATDVAAEVTIPQGAHFSLARRRVRDRLTDSGILKRIDELVATLLL